MRDIGNLINYIHSYEQYLYLFDLKEEKFIKTENETIHENYNDSKMCVYCSFKQNDELSPIACDHDVDISTRTKFFKHLQKLEERLNRRLVCLEKELENFIESNAAQNFIDKYGQGLKRKTGDDESETPANDSSFSEFEHNIEQNLNLNKFGSMRKRIRINLIDRSKTFKRNSSTERGDDDFSDASSVLNKAESVASLDNSFILSSNTPFTALLTEPIKSVDDHSNLSTHLNSPCSTTSHSVADLDEATSSSTFELSGDLAFSQPLHSSTQRVKSIKQFREEYNDCLDELNLDYKYDDVIINEIIVRGNSSETRFLCYLNDF